jgi:hypothetical protein
VSGGDVGSPTYPSIVDVKMVRAQAALDRASAAIDQSQAAGVDLAAARSNMASAWTAEQYVIETAPPAVGGGTSAITSGAPVGAGITYASPEETGLAVLTLQHSILTTVVGLMDNPGGISLTDLRVTVRAALNARDAAIEYIHALPTPPPGDRAQPKQSKKAKTSGAPVAAGWATVMPNVVSLIDDEIQQIRGMVKTDPALSPAVRRSFATWRLRDSDAKDTINAYWPPPPAG